VQVTGPYASTLSAGDIQHIKELVFARKHEHYQHVNVAAKRPDQVTVETIRMYSPATIYSDFDAVRRGGTWIIKERPAVQPQQHVLLY
jgi:hypothetical protein